MTVCMNIRLLRAEKGLFLLHKHFNLSVAGVFAEHGSLLCRALQTVIHTLIVALHLPFLSGAQHTTPSVRNATR